LSLSFLALWWALTAVHAGGGPANVLVLYNAEEDAARDLAEYYQTARDIPSGHLCAINDVDPTSRTIEFADYALTIRPALDACLLTLPQPDEIHTLVLIRGLPYLVDIEDGFSTSLGAMLQVGDTTRSFDGTPLAGSPQAMSWSTWIASVQNPAWIQPGPMDDYTIENDSAAHYRSAPKITEQDTQPRSFTRSDMDYGSTWDFSSGLFLVSRLDGFDYSDGYDLVDRAIASETAVPTDPITCMAAADSARGARDPECAYTIEMLDSVGVPAQWLSAHDSTLSDTPMAGYLTGTTSLHNAIDDNTYAPGAFACNLTSTGAYPKNFYCDETGEICPEDEAQTSIARFVRAGLTGAHGTVAEPLNNSFPGAGMMLLYTMGYNMVESAFFTQHYVYWQNLYLGDPLTSPWAERPVVSVDAETPHPVNLPLDISAEHTRGIGEMALYVNGVRLGTGEGSLSLSPEALGLAAGDTVDLLAIATANNAVIDRPGWPSGETYARPDVQGWLHLSLEVGAAVDIPEPMDTGTVEADTGIEHDEAGDVDTGEDAGDKNEAKNEGCACSTGTPPSTLFLGLLGACVATRRRPKLRSRPRQRSE
jgi:uncharacterized protein (TIGR03790 family)